MGRPAKPLALHKLEGTLRNDRHGEAPQVPPSMPDIPEHLDDIAQQEWHRLTAEMLTIGTLARIDRAMLAAHCTTYSRWVQAEQQIAAHGVIIKTVAGEARVSPWVKVAQDSLALLRQYATDLGLSPSSRSRLHVVIGPKRGGVSSRKWAGLLAGEPHEDTEAFERFLERHA